MDIFHIFTVKVHLSVEAEEGIYTHSAEQILLISERQLGCWEFTREKNAFVFVSAHARLLQPALHVSVLPAAVLQQKAEKVCGGEIRMARLLQGLALLAQGQTQVRQTSSDVSTE